MFFKGPDGFGVVQVLQGGSILGAQARSQKEKGGEGR